ncbi:hypothetical protein LOD99_5869 [Oopsacas minuta]|uniref:Uncharacterized protein n=1 Tax=Oopsacas minuta TaxID=111878 RepID=A0AAV7JN86_9METZ|nr:hypothetical protein LOD99_5869 [Oopsacas minuta]
MAAQKERGSTFSFWSHSSTRHTSKQAAVDISGTDSLRAELRGNISELKNLSSNKNSMGRFSNSTENLAESIDEDGIPILPPPPTFLGRILRSIEKSEFQELVDQIPDEKPLSRDEMNFLNGTGSLTLRELRATTGALLSLGWDNASQYTDGVMKIGGLRPCRQQAQQRITELISNIHSRTLDSPIPLQLVFDLTLGYLPLKPGFLYKPKFNNSIEIFGPSEDEVLQTSHEVEKRLTIPTFVRTQFKYNKVTCFLGCYHPTRQFSFETVSKDYLLYNLPKGSYQYCTFADATSNEMDMNTQGLMNLAGILKQSVPKIKKTSGENNSEEGREIAEIPKSGIWNASENLIRYIMTTRIPVIIYQNHHPYFFCQLGKVVYSNVPPEIKSNIWNIEETFYQPKLVELTPHFNTNAKLDIEEVCKKLGVKQKATINYRLQVKHLDHRNYLIFTFTFRMDGQPNVISAESPEHHKVSMNCMCPDKKYDISFIIAKKETLLDMDTQARFLSSLKLNDCGQLICDPANEYEVISAESIDCNTIQHGHYIVSCEQKQVLYTSDISRMLFYTKSLQPAQGKLLIDFSYGRRMSQVTAESLYFHDNIDKLSYEHPWDTSENGSLDRSSMAPSPDAEKGSKDFVVFSPIHGLDTLQPGDQFNIRRDRSTTLPDTSQIHDAGHNLYISNEAMRRSVRRPHEVNKDTNQDLITIAPQKYGSNENLDSTQNTRQSTIQQLKRVGNPSVKLSNSTNRPGNTRFLHIEETDTFKQIEKIVDHDLEPMLDLILTII